MSVLNINAGTQSFNQDWRRPESKRRRVEADPVVNSGITGSFEDLIEVDAERSHLPAGSLNSRIVDAESSVSVIQTAVAGIQLLEEKLDRIQDLLMKTGREEQHSCHELGKHLAEFDEAAAQVCFDGETLLDGTHDVNGSVSGEYIELVEMGNGLCSSPVSGYPVRIEQTAARAEMQGRLPLSQRLIDEGEQLLLQVGASRIRYTTRSGDDLERTIERMKHLIARHRLEIDVMVQKEGILHVRHRQYGSSYGFGAASSTPGVLSEKSAVISPAHPGRDVAGTINGEACIGRGQLLRAESNSKRIGGLVLRFFGGNDYPLPSEAGRITIFQNAFCFGKETSASHSKRLAIPDLRRRNLGRDVKNTSGYSSLADIGNQPMAQTDDALKIIDKAIFEVTEEQHKLEEFDRLHIRYRLDELKQEHELSLPANVFPRNGNHARKMAEWTREQIIKDSGHSTMVQSQQKSGTVYSLLK